MGFLQAFKMAVKSILSNKVRSFLTMLGVIIGVGAVISAVAFAQGSTKSVTDQIKGLGTNLIQINITGRSSNRNLKYADLQQFADENTSEVSAVSPQVNSNVTVKYNNKSVSTSLVGTSPDYQVIQNVNVEEGRFLLSFDMDYMQRVAVIGTAVVKQLFDIEDPIDKDIKINGQLFKVVGILEQKADGQVQSTDDRVIIPVNVAQRLTKNAIISTFSVQAATPESVNSVIQKLNELLTGIYKSTNTFRVSSQAQMLSTLDNVTSSMMLILGGIATISLIVGGIGIMNIMLVSVTERTREIGIRKAIGARRKNILMQFLIEALMVTGMGGILGVILGISVIHYILGGFNIVPEVYSLFWMVMSFGISLVVGVIFGMFPAFKAANLDPIVALRHE